jgi:very-short-patch-repair endonuclease
MLQYNKSLKEYSRKLRKNMTDVENLLWWKIRNKQLKGYQFYRQKIMGNYIVDFYCPKAKIVVELDGGQHYTEEGKLKDLQRDKYMKDIGLKVLRFSDTDILDNLSGVVEKIFDCL